MTKRKKQGLIDLLREQVDISFNYIIESRRYVYSVIGFFIFSVLLGFFVIPLNAELSEMIRKQFGEILLKTENLNTIGFILFIFNNNLLVSFYTLFFGVALGIFPLAACLANGAVVGFALFEVYSVSGLSNFWMLLPHGIFELPAIFISIGLGVKFGAFIFSKEPRKAFLHRAVNSARVFIFIVLPLLVLAAVIEGALIFLLK